MSSCVVETQPCQNKSGIETNSCVIVLPSLFILEIVMNGATVTASAASLFYNFLKSELSLPGVPALLAPTEKLCIGAAPKDRLRARPEPDWGYWKLAEVFSGEEGTLRGGRGSVKRSNIIRGPSHHSSTIQPWRMDLLSSDGV